MSSKLDDWLNQFGEKSLPMPQRHHQYCKKALLAEGQELQTIAWVADRDPALSLALLSHVNKKREASKKHEITSIQSAIGLLGVQGLTRVLESIPVLEDQTKDLTIIKSYMQLYLRVHHGAMQACEFADIRNDSSPGEIFLATQMHFIAQLAICFFDHDHYLSVREIVGSKRLPYAVAEMNVFGFDCRDLGYALAEKLKLPELALNALQASNFIVVRSQSIMLGVELARLAESGWYHADMEVCLEVIADFLGMPFIATAGAIHQISLQAAQLAPLVKGQHSASLLVCHLPPVEDDSEGVSQAAVNPELLRDVVKDIRESVERGIALHELIHDVLYAMHKGLGLERVIFFMLNQGDKSIKARLMLGVSLNSPFAHFELKMKDAGLFNILLTKQQSLWLHDENRGKYGSKIPVAIKSLIRTDDFFAMSVFAGEKPIGLFYADCPTLTENLNKGSYQKFKALCMLASRGLTVAKKGLSKSVE